MAIKIFDKFSPRANAPSANYPAGSIKNESVPGVGDGTPLDADWGNDYAGFDAALLAEAEIQANGNPDTAIASQRLEAMKALFQDHSKQTNRDESGSHPASAITTGGENLDDWINDAKNLIKKGDFISGGVASDERDCFKFSDGFYYRNVSLNYPVTVIPGSEPDADWACVGLLINGYPVYSPDNFGFETGDDAYHSFQKCFDSMPFGGSFDLIAGNIYEFKSQPAKIRRPGNYRGNGLFHNLPTNQHHAQIINSTNGLVFEIAFYWGTPGWKEGGQYNRVIEGFKVKGDKILYPQSGFIAAPASQTSTVIRQCDLDNMGFGICPLTSYGMIIEQNVIRNCETAVTSNPAKYAPTGAAHPEGPSKDFWQTNVIRIRDNLFTDNAYGVDFNCPGNSITVHGNVSERQLVNFWFSSMVGFPAGFDGRVLRGLEVNGNYLEAASVAHIIMGRDTADGLPASSPIGVKCLTNQINGDGTPDDSGLITLLAVQDAEFDNSFRNRATSNIVYDLGQGNCSNAKVKFSTGETHKGYFNRFGSNSMEFGDISATRPGNLFTLHVNAGSPDNVPLNQCFDVNAGTESKPLADTHAAMELLRCFSNELIKNNITSVNLVCTGNIGVVRGVPAPVTTVSFSLGAGSTPTSLSGMPNISGGKYIINGAFKLTNGDKATVAPWSCFNADVAINGASFEFTGQPGGSLLFKANRLSNVSIVNCSTSVQLPLASDASIMMVNSPSLTGSRIKTNSGQIFE